jgi:phosphoribosylaminoimidazole-succinocarboxamide synthase
MTDEYCREVSERYIELYEHVTGRKFDRAAEGEDTEKSICEKVEACLETL